MSVFDDTQTPTFELLVGEDKKFKTPDDLVRGKIEADETIKARNRELEEQRIEMNRLREELERLREPQGNNAERVQTSPVEEKKPEQDLASRIREELERQTQEDRKNQNLTQVVNHLEELYGEKANEVVRNRAAELGVSVSFLEGIAATSPKAFFAQLGEQSSDSNVQSTSSDVNTSTFVNTQSSSSEAKPGTYKYYEKIRRDDPKLYFSAEIQNRMFIDAKKAGDAFYN